MKLNKNVMFVLIIFVMMAIGVANILIKKNILIFVEVLLGIGLIGIYVYINEKRLFLFSFWSVMLSELISEYIPQMEYSLYFFSILLVFKLLEKKFIKKEKFNLNKLIIILTIMLFLINVISVIYNGYSLSISLILFGTLKKFSFIILYIFYINADISDRCIVLNFKLMFIFALIQFPILIGQYLFGITQDNISGTFGNSGTGILLQYFMNIMILLPIINKECKKIKISYLLFAVMILFYCAIAEVKLGFIIIPFVYVLILISEGRYVKLILNSIILIFTLAVIYSFFVKIYPEHDFIKKIDFSKSYLENAYGAEAVNRSNFMPLLNRTILQSRYKRAFGTGIATANPSSVESLEGPIAREYSYMNIHFFSLPYSIIENGLIGTIIWLGIYVYILMSNLYKYFKQRNSKCAVSILICIVTFIFIYYNSSMNTSNVIIMQVWFILSSIAPEKRVYSIDEIKESSLKNKILINK